MPAAPHLHLEGHLVATAEVVDTYRHDRDEWHQLFLFRADEGYTLVTFARSETYGDTGRLDASHQHDDDLHVCWAPERLRRDLDRASLYDRRLAVTTGFIGGESSRIRRRSRSSFTRGFPR